MKEQLRPVALGQCSKRVLVTRSSPPNQILFHGESLPRDPSIVVRTSIPLSPAGDGEAGDGLPVIGALGLGDEEDDLLMSDLAGLVDGIQARAVEVHLALAGHVGLDRDQDHRCLAVAHSG